MAKKKQSSGASATRVRESRQAERQERMKNTRTAPAAATTQVRQKVRKRVAASNRSWMWIGGIIVASLLVIGVFVYIANNQKVAGVIGSTDTGVMKAVTTVKTSVLEDVNTGGLQQSIMTPIQGQPALTGADGKPQVFYYGAEFCPYCAANRWSMVIALSRFGTFSQLPQTLSSGTDTDPNTSTFTFVGSKYTSSVLDFVPVEAEDRDGKALQIPTAEQQQLLQTFKITGFPFLDIANKYQSGVLYDPAVLANLSQKDIAGKLADPNDTVTKNIVGAANYLTAGFCAVTKNLPADVCTAGAIPSIVQSIGGPTGALPFNNQGGSGMAAVVESRRWG